MGLELYAVVESSMRFQLDSALEVVSAAAFDPLNSDHDCVEAITRTPSRLFAPTD